ncbi:hypothetical protein RA8P1_00087 (plasmid) [Variovorax sp. RA8]|nr:hypothetical protein RA8P1_00087 [Variovorax sp. RA8]
MRMTVEIHHLLFDNLPPVSRGQGIVNYPIATKKQGAVNIHSGITRLPAGGVVPAHSHNAEEQVTVLEGRLRIVLNGVPHDCGPYDSTFISAGVVHEFSAIGEEPAVAMVIYGSANVNRTFAETGETVVLGSDADKFPPDPARLG